MISFRFALILCLVVALTSFAAAVSRADDRLSQIYRPGEVTRYAFQLHVEPNWIGRTGVFWYLRETAQGRVYVLVDPEEGSMRPLFDHAQLADALSRETGVELDRAHLRLEGLEIGEDFKTLSFSFRTVDYVYTLDTAGLSRPEPDSPRTPGLSGDGAWRAYTRDHNLFVERIADGEVIQLTHDGDAEHPYATPVINPRLRLEGRWREDHADVTWSWNNRYLATYQMALAGASRFSMPDEQGEIVYEYPRSMDEVTPQATPVIFDLQSGERVDIKVSPLPVLYYGAPGFTWVDDDEMMFVATRRGYGQRTAYNFDVSSRDLRIILREESETFVNIYEGVYWQIYDWDRLLWISDISGNTHIHLADMNGGQSVRQITDGDWQVIRPVDIVESRDEIYFMASGRREGVDPYYRALYRIKRYGGEPELLTNDSHDHSVYMSPLGDYIVDNISEVDMPTRSVLRRSRDGAVIMDLGGADISLLQAEGYEAPERFGVTLTSGETLYGVIYRPANFDEQARYPVIEHVYTGPHTYNAAISFYRGLNRSHAQSVANAGFMVVEIDTEGTAGRSRAFLQAAYKNLAEVGLDSRISVLEALAQVYPQLDLTRVGAFGFSAGGYDVVRMLTRRPEFYSVGAASSGNYDSRWDKAVWNEQWLGVDEPHVYDANSMLNSVHRLQGRLLLSHGLQDENVPAAATRVLVDAFETAGKSDQIEVRYYPRGGHFLQADPVYLERRIAFFAEHLGGPEPLAH